MSIASVAKSDYSRHQFFLAGVAMLVLSLVALFFLVISWVVGGDAFMASIFGKETMVLLLAGAVGGVALMLIYREKHAITVNAAANPALHGNSAASA